MQEKYKLEPLELEKEEQSKVVEKEVKENEKQSINFSFRFDAKVERQGFSEKKSFDFIHLISNSFIRIFVFVFITVIVIYLTYFYLFNN